MPLNIDIFYVLYFKKFYDRNGGGSMKHSILAFVIALFVAIPANATLTQSEGCYQIGSADDLYELADLYDSLSYKDDDEVAALLRCAELTQDIVVNENVLKKDGTPNAGPFRKWKTMYAYFGVLDGRNHTISGLYQVDTLSDVGFLRGGNGLTTVKNLGIEDSYFASEYGKGRHLASAGSFFSFSGDTVIIDSCFSAATVEVYAELDGIGGLVGDAGRSLVIRNSRNEGRVFQTDEKRDSVDEYPSTIAAAGGLVGYSGYTSEVRIENSYNAGPVTGADVVGGLVGISEKRYEDKINPKKLIIEGSYNSGTINTLSSYRYYSAGGLVGEGMGVIKESYNIGAVSGLGIVGGLVGSVSFDSLRIENSFNRGALVSRGIITDLEELKKDYDEVVSLTGGFVGIIFDSKVIISNSYSASENYSGKDSVNSVVGYVEGFGSSDIAAGEVQICVAKYSHDSAISFKYSKIHVDGRDRGKNIEAAIKEALTATLEHIMS
jgi:hypothetical protein